MEVAHHGALMMPTVWSKGSFGWTAAATGLPAPDRIHLRQRTFRRSPQDRGRLARSGRERNGSVREIDAAPEVAVRHTLRPNRDISL